MTGNGNKISTLEEIKSINSLLRNLFFFTTFRRFSRRCRESCESGANPWSASFNDDVLCRNLLSLDESNFKGQRPGVTKWNLRNRNAATEVQSKSLPADETIHSADPARYILLTIGKYRWRAEFNASPERVYAQFRLVCRAAIAGKLKSLFSRRRPSRWINTFDYPTCTGREQQRADYS